MPVVTLQQPFVTRSGIDSLSNHHIDHVRETRRKVEASQG
jgi:hypothetical protein